MHPTPSLEFVNAALVRSGFYRLPWSSCRWERSASAWQPQTTEEVVVTPDTVEIHTMPGGRAVVSHAGLLSMYLRGEL